MHVPALPTLGDHRDAFLVITGQCADDFRLPGRTKPYRLADAEIQHLCVGPHLMQKAKTGNDLVVQVDKFFFGQPVDPRCLSWLVEFHGIDWWGTAQDRRPRMTHAWHAPRVPRHTEG